jgi:ABC-type branched-subunit amino acid transport system ATPase component
LAQVNQQKEIFRQFTLAENLNLTKKEKAKLVGPKAFFFGEKHSSVWEREKECTTKNAIRLRIPAESEV